MSRSNLSRRFPPSEPCSCSTCLNYCRRPGWWTVEEATRAMDEGYAKRMMMEMSPELTFGVLSPAFKGNEGNLAMQIYSDQSCTFLAGSLCELFGTGLQPLECRFCHHTRQGLGKECHSALENDWHSKEGQRLVLKWSEETRIFERYGLIVEKGNKA